MLPRKTKLDSVSIAVQRDVHAIIYHYVLCIFAKLLGEKLFMLVCFSLLSGVRFAHGKWVNMLV